MYSGHFAGNKLYNALVKHWWWDGMNSDVIAFCKKCPECTQRRYDRKLHVQCAFVVKNVLISIPTSWRS